jgi:4-carboxymuconolactone decarboxylase
MTDAFAKLFQHVTDQGAVMARGLQPAMENMPVNGFEKLFPTMASPVLEMWFGKIFNREGLDARNRFLVTNAALTVMGAQSKPQIKLTVRNALATGALKHEVAEVVGQMRMFGGLPAIQKAPELAQAVFAEEERSA